MPCIARINPNILRLCTANFLQQHCHPVDIRLASDQSGFGVLYGLMHQMLAAPKANFKPDRTGVEHLGQIQRGAIRILGPTDWARRKLRKVAFQRFFLSGAQRFAFKAPVKIAPGRA